MPSPGDFLKSAPYFSALSGKEFEQVKKEAAEQFFAKGEFLFLEGDPCRGLYLVKSGRIRVFKSSPEGRETTAMPQRFFLTF